MKNTNKKNILFLLITSVVLLLAGCSKVPDCSEMDTTYEKYKLNTETTTCELYKEIEKNQCGNGVVEEGNNEDFCSCPKDVAKTHPTLGCYGSKGEYLEYTCTQSETCELQQNNKVVEQTKSIDFKSSDITLRGEFSINTPFILDTVDNNKVTANLDYFKGPSSSSVKLRNVLVKELILKNSKGITFGTQDYNEQLSALGQNLRVKEFELSKTTSYQSSETLKAELVVSYIKDTYNSKGEVSKSEEKIETLKATIGTWDVINPNFDVPKKR